MENFYNWMSKPLPFSESQVDYREAIPEFIEELFDLNKPFAKSDLDILTELYKTLQNKVIHVG